MFGMCLPLIGVSVLLINEPEAPAVSYEPAFEPVPGASAPNVTLASVPSRVTTVAEPEQIPVESPPTTLLELQVAAAERRGQRINFVIQRGESLDYLFGRHKLSRSDLAAMLALPEAAEPLKRVKPGDVIDIVALDSSVLSLHRELDEIRELWITKDDSGFSATIVDREIDTRTVAAHGTIETSLFEAANDAGLADWVTMNLAGIFQWDIDFIQDVRVGDNFTVIHQELWRDGVKLRNGRIVAAEFVNRGQSFRAAYYTDGSGRSDYYTPEGRSVRKAFIRAPVDFTRISGAFNPNRRHPILNTIRAHRGVDYAAPTGTPVKAAGDGVVDFRGVNGGYGNAIVLRHGGNITTLYAHLSRFGQYRVGARVKQEDIIGYVGQTGLATGPHLHYEYRIDGLHRNPRTVALPDAAPVPPEYHADFEATTASLWRQLDLYEPRRYASSAE